METYDDPENGCYMYYMYYINYTCYMYYMHYMYNMYYTYYVYYIYYFVFAGWLNTIGSQILYELDRRKPILYVIAVEHILGKLPLVPVGDTGTISHHLRRNLFPGAPGDRRPDAGDGCRMWFVNSWAMAFSLNM
jgi:hypothetical protein